MASSSVLQRTRVFSLSIIRLYRDLPRSEEARVIGRQILRSATSVGAHVHEGKRSRSIAEMISKTEIALQELEETTYWLELLKGSEIIGTDTGSNFLAEANELMAMLVSSTKSLKRIEKR